MVYIFLNDLVTSDLMAGVEFTPHEFEDLKRVIPETMASMKNGEEFTIPTPFSTEQSYFVTEKDIAALEANSLGYLVDRLDNFFAEAVGMSTEVTFELTISEPIKDMISNFMSFAKGVTDREWLASVLSAIPASKEDGCFEIGGGELVHSQPSYIFPTSDVITAEVQRCSYTTYVARYKDGRVALIRGEPTSGKHNLNGEICEYRRNPQPVLDWHEMDTLTRVTHGAYEDLDYNYGVSWKHFKMCYRPTAESLDVRVQSS